jgi:hypothetical protein
MVYLLTMTLEMILIMKMNILNRKKMTKKAKTFLKILGLKKHNKKKKKNSKSCNRLSKILKSRISQQKLQLKQRTTSQNNISTLGTTKHNNNNRKNNLLLRMMMMKKKKKMSKNK